MGRSPSKSGDVLLNYHTEAIMELTATLNENERRMEVIETAIKSRKQNPITLAKIIRELLELNESTVEAMEKAVADIRVAEAIRKQESPRRIAALKREAKKRE